MKIEFSGAARTVTGSKHLLHINGKKILLDCGLFQGHRKKAAAANANFPFEASEIDAVVLSHAHIDHAGALPLLVKKGFTGPIFCTHATRDLCSIMLADSAHIQEKDAEFVKKRNRDTAGEPLYTMEDAERTMVQFRSVAYEQPFKPMPGVTVTFKDAGHILGSAMEEWVIEDKELNKTIRFGFTGDLGRRSLPVLKDPRQIENLDVLLTESTYGNRMHDELKSIEDDLAKKLEEVRDRGGKIIIPAFAVGRTQEILYVFRELQHQGKFPKMPIFVDSPLSYKATSIFGLHPECFDKETNDMISRGQDPFCHGCDGVQFTESVNESKALNDFPGACIIISASGMCEAGRIKHHLANTIEDPKNLVLVIGFMAQNTLGRKIVDHEEVVNIFGEPHQLKAEVVIMRAFSAHGDQNDLVNFASGTGSPKNIFLVHGEEESMEIFKGKLLEKPNLAKSIIEAPAPGDIWYMDADGTMKKGKEFNELSRQIEL